MGEREHHMEVGGINDFRPACIHPDLFLDGLAVWAVTVSAGAVVDLGMAAVLALADGEAEGAALTAHDGMGSLQLDRKEGGGGNEGFPAGFKNLLDLIPCHHTHLPVCPEG